MQRSEFRVHIIGAGVSGLVAAAALENRGYSPVILERSDRSGGRLKTDEVQGHLLDRGFQVLLTAYPMLHRYLHLEKLNLQYYKPGAVLFQNGSHDILGDPSRDRSFAWSTFTSRQATFKDKILILKLNRDLKKLKPEAIFEEPDQSTHQFLHDYGFSEKVIANFFRPFFAGIFLEPGLETSSRMFRFIYKMFGQGKAAVPAAGIEAIPRQLENNLEMSSLHFNSEVCKVEEGQITMSTGEEIPSHATIIAAEASPIVPRLSDEQEWKGCDNLYFETPDRVFTEPLIALLTTNEGLINNLSYPSSLTQPGDSPHLLSVTVVREHQLGEEDMIQQVRGELQAHFGIQNARFLKHYHIPRALPQIESTRYSIEPSETRLSESIFLAGDQLLNPSLNAAMLSGESAANALADYLDSQ